MPSIIAVLVAVAALETSPDDAWHPAVPPTAEFTTRTSVVITWETARTMSARVRFGLQGGKQKIVRGSSERGRRHRVEITGLVGARPYTWQVLGTVKGRRVATSLEVLDPKFNYTVAKVAGGPDP